MTFAEQDRTGPKTNPLLRRVGIANIVGLEGRILWSRPGRDGIFRHVTIPNASTRA
jgi:hypothetical protein